MKIQTTWQLKREWFGWKRMALLCFFCGVACWYGAMASLHRFSTDPDTAVCVQMAYDVEAGGPLPVFFYGQDYMGSLEPLLGALWCHLLGATPLSVNLATSTFSFLFFVLVFLWSRSLFGWVGAFGAAAFLLIGPGTYTIYAHRARGGYAVLLCLITAILWLSSRILHSEGRPEKRIGHLGWFLCGMLGGLGWWTNQSALIAAVAVVVPGLIVFRRSLFSWRILSALMGGVVGLGLYWRALIDAPSVVLNMTGGFGSVSLPVGIARIFSYHLPAYFSGGQQPDMLGWVQCVLLLACFLACALVYLRFPTLRSSYVSFCMFTLLSFFVVVVFIVSQSHFVMEDAPRYVLILTPLLALCFGGVVDLVWRRAGRWGGVAAFALIVALQLPVLLNLYAVFKKDAAEHVHAKQLSEYCSKQGLRTVYVDYHDYALNNRSRETVFTDFSRQKRYASAVASELSSDFAALKRCDLLSHCLHNLSSTYESVTYGPFTCVHDVSPLYKTVRPVFSDSLIGQESSLIDGDWSSRIVVPCGGTRSIEFELNEAVEVCGVDLFSSSQTFLKMGTFRVLPVGSDNWVTVKSDVFKSHWFPSGPRLFYGGESAYLRVLWFGQRIRAVGMDITGPGDLCEINVLSPSEKFFASADVEALFRSLENEDVQSVYSGRYVANALYRLSGGALKTSINGYVLDAPEKALPSLMVLSKHTVIVSEPGYAVATRASLRAKGLPFQEMAVGYWTLFSFPSWSGDLPSEVMPGLFWNGKTAFLDAPRVWAEFRCLRSDAWIGSKREDELRSVLKILPGFIPAQRRLLDICLKNGDMPKADLIRRNVTPEVRLDSAFQNGMLLKGVRFLWEEHTLRLLLSWRLPEKIPTAPLSVFVHMKGVEGQQLAFDSPFVDLCAKYTPRDRDRVTQTIIPLADTLDQGDVLELTVGLYQAYPPFTRIFARTKGHLGNRGKINIFGVVSSRLD